MKSFARFARREGISNETLSNAIREIEKGLNDGDLGGGLIKKRVARTGKGKRGGYRTIIAYGAGIRSVFLYGFPKNAKDNLDDLELDSLQKLAKIYLQLSDAEMAKALNAGEIEEVDYAEEKI
jgi:hypothetical protein